VVTMSNGWKSYLGAPREETVLCRVDEIANDGVKSLALDTGAGKFPILLVKSRGDVRAFVNACPHQYLPLDYRGDKLLSADGSVIWCTNHAAGFRLADGVGVEGYGIGCALDAIPVSVDGEGWVRIDAAPSAEAIA
jgi:nitrite reductase/ring-hydroxylating ferredoxin subunit